MPRLAGQHADLPVSGHQLTQAKGVCIVKLNLPVTGRSIPVGPQDNILSTTDLKGAITYVNSDFVAISGFEQQELLGTNHHIVRHPDMPPAAFTSMWHSLKSGKSWMGLVKNRCKNGDHYWVNAYATPVMRNGSVVEYQSVRTQASSKMIERAEALYAQIRAGKTPSGLKPALLTQAGRLSLLCGLPIVAVGFLLGVMDWLPLVAAVAGSLGLAGLVSGILHIALRPLGRLARQARHIAQNPLSQLVYTGRNDEYGQIAFALQSLEAEAGAMVGRIADSADQLHRSANELVRMVDSTDQATLHQKERKDQVALAVDQMSLSVQEVSQHTELSNKAVVEATQETESGLHLVTENRQQILGLAEDIQQCNQTIQQLEQHSNSISHMLAVIKGIADQTNLLALNAAIEAARAGEAGRGFAVVADEVRALASRTQQSTAEIQGIIANLQRGTQEAVVAMQNSHQQAESSVKQVLEAATALESIHQRVDRINQMNAQIAGAVERQEHVSEQIQHNLHGIHQACEHNIETSHHSRHNANHVAGLAERLQLLAEQFRRQLQEPH